MHMAGQLHHQGCVLSCACWGIGQLQTARNQEITTQLHLSGDQDKGPVEVHAAAAALQELSAEAAELQARLADLATPLAAPLPEAAAATVEHLASPHLQPPATFPLRNAGLTACVRARSCCTTALPRPCRCAGSRLPACPGVRVPSARSPASLPARAVCSSGMVATQQAARTARLLAHCRPHCLSQRTAHRRIEWPASKQNDSSQPP